MSSKNIALMLRSYDRPGGIGIYTKNITKFLLELDSKNNYFLFYNNAAHLNTFSYHPNVKEIFVHQTNPILWDQYLIPLELEKYKIDLVFNTKFSVPVLSKAKKVMVLHGASWFTNPEFYSAFDLIYVRTTMPVYCRKADYLISNSELTSKDFIKLMNLSPEKVETIYLAAGKEFNEAPDQFDLNEVKQKYNIPPRFLLTVTSYDDKRKNFKTLINAFEKINQVDDEICMVIVGKDCKKYINDYNLKSKAYYNKLFFPGWIEQTHVVSLYYLAEAFLFPSVYEEFGIPIVEAMTTGCPIVASDSGAIPEIAGDAAILCNPFNPDEFAHSALTVMHSEELKNDLIKKGFKRAKDFSWEIAAKKTYDALERVLWGFNKYEYH